MRPSVGNTGPLQTMSEDISDIRLKESAEKTASVGDNFGGNPGSNDEPVEDAGQESLNKLPPYKPDNLCQ